MTVIRKLSALIMLLLILSTFCIPVMAAGGNGGSAGSDGAGGNGGSAGSEGAGPGGSGGNGSGGDSAGNSGSGVVSPGPDGTQAQTLQEEQERKQQETIDQPGVQINLQDRDQTQGRTGVDTADTTRQRDRDLFLQQVSLQEQNLSRDQDREQAQLDIALYALSISSNVTGSGGPELTRLGAELNNSLALAYQAEQQIKTRNSFTRMLVGGDREAAGLLIQYADQNRQRIQQMEQLLGNCSDCDPQVRAMLEEQVRVLSQEQNRLTTIGQQEQGERGLFGWLFGGTRTLAGSGQAVTLTDDEKYWLTYMREEEKLARDVYLTLGGTWNLPVFSSIAQSEQVHMDSVKTLLDRYGLPDPASGKAQGEFTSPELQKLHDDLITQGSSSSVEALKVGVLIEETDISDLNKAIATTQKNDIKTVYSNLLQGSLNHLNAFESNLARY